MLPWHHNACFNSSLTPKIRASSRFKVSHGRNCLTLSTSATQKDDMSVYVDHSGLKKISTISAQIFLSCFFFQNENKVGFYFWFAEKCWKGVDKFYYKIIFVKTQVYFFQPDLNYLRVSVPQEGLVQTLSNCFHYTNLRK